MKVKQLNFALPNDEVLDIPDPRTVAALSEPAWIRVAKLKSIYNILDFAHHLWSKVPAENRALMEAKAVERGEKLPRHFISVTIMRIKALAGEVQNEIGDMTGRLTGKSVIFSPDIELLLMKAGLSYTVLPSIPDHMVAMILSNMLAANKSQNIF